ncbi:MAG: acetate--CoA ligase [Candidatus Marinimicrobia bacterium]|mgnify:FL=1|jgi:acetyl-CoA synthetase|nr:acetate--CoA ligase [Candidatus Neomarinimicrobiota bacterium]MBT3632300.1 acetate--CoA ligase [Candidatus Neomarinimicrobiota bacterium]MBT3825970.1 acetate--CoA ligase [Candidatus Neomarinimicrobiota bacterium]MBT4131355.1 acetate--CoA ligase [Candidatus Neomarinimicrobiota bacterium]MBT4418744.1 acetate--CoA ligase [Candidatus Neomarinimicrobiota bacterium]
MSEVKKFNPAAEFTANAHIKSMEQYQEMYDRSVNDEDGFWAEQAERLTWFKKWDTVANYDLATADIKWYEGGKLNVSYNCLDRHVEDGYGDRTAMIWEGNNPTEDKTFTYNELLSDVQKFSNVLKSHGVVKGDRVCIYMQMIPELSVAMLACSRIGAIHSIVFGAFSPESLRDRINDSECKVLITQDTGVRGKKLDIPMKSNADKALAETPSIKTCVVVKRTGAEVNMDSGRDIWWHEGMTKVDAVCAPEEMDAEDPLFILYTSGSTGKPKGVLHTTGGYLVYASMTHEMVFDYHEDDVYWCTADIGWVTGHSYIVYGPLANRSITMMFEGVPNYPDFGRFWDVVDKHKVNLFYTAPTALRALMREGNEWVETRDLSSLRLLGTVGETIKSPEWNWYYNIVGKGKCPIVDTWWQTETGGILITPLPGITPLKPGSATIPFFGVQPVLLTEEGKEIEGNDKSGLLAMKAAWPGMMRTLYGDHERFKQAYFSMYPGYYFSGDGARRDVDGDYWITGRVDDVLNVSGHRIGTAEVEGAIGKADGVAEAAVVGFPHDIKGQGIYAYVTLMAGIEGSDEILASIAASVRKEIGPHAKPDKVQFTPALPKTRSGKIMRRILRKIAENEVDSLGDISTLADPSVVDSLVAERK